MDSSLLGKGGRSYFVLLETGIKTAPITLLTKADNFSLVTSQGELMVFVEVSKPHSCLPQVSEIFFMFI